MDETSSGDFVHITTSLLLGEASAPDYQAIISDIANFEPIHAEPLPDDGSIIAWKGRAFIATLEKQPLPRHAYHSIAVSTVFWPEAMTELARHKAILHLSSRVPRAELLQGLVDQTLLVRCCMAHLPVRGVLWGAALTKPEWFEFLFARLQHTGRLPIPAWIQIQMSWGDGKTIVSTIGMRELGLMEVECNPSPLAPDPTLDVVQYFISYLLAEGPVVDDGGSFSLSEDLDAYGEPIRVHHAPSFRSGVGAVYLLDFSWTS